MSEPTMVEQLGEHVLRQLPKSMGYDQRIKIMHSIQDFVRQWVDREQKAEWDLDAINERLQTERDEALAALFWAIRNPECPPITNQPGNLTDVLDWKDNLNRAVKMTEHLARHDEIR